MQGSGEPLVSRLYLWRWEESVTKSHGVEAGKRNLSTTDSNASRENGTDFSKGISLNVLGNFKGIVGPVCLWYVGPRLSY
jgi:hypothetical protein